MKSLLLRLKDLTLKTLIYFCSPLSLIILYSGIQPVSPFLCKVLSIIIQRILLLVSSIMQIPSWSMIGSWFPECTCLTGVCWDSPSKIIVVVRANNLLLHLSLSASIDSSGSLVHRLNPKLVRPTVTSGIRIGSSIRYHGDVWKTIIPGIIFCHSPSIRSFSFYFPNRFRKYYYWSLFYPFINLLGEVVGLCLTCFS